VLGAVVAQGLADEHADRRYLISLQAEQMPHRNRKLNLPE
jgi:hypothetical protein